MSTFIISLVLLFGVLALLAAEAIDVQLRIRKIPIRIHVNGTRGKSSVTQYIAAGLRSSGKITLAKITGITPTIILPDGSRKVIYRRGRARLQEQLKIIRQGSRISADTLVLECMSISPELQRLEARLLRPQFYVITNIRDDHREQMGFTDEERVQAICSAIPPHCTVVTVEKKHLAQIRDFASSRGSRVVLADPLDESIRGRLPAGAFAENIALAATICRLAGSDPATSLQAIMQEISRDNQFVFQIADGGRRISFVDGFSVNDVDSAKDFFSYWTQQIGASGDLVVILNTRMDRPLRTAEFAEWCATISGLTAVVLTGTHVPFARRVLMRNRFSKPRIHVWTEKEIARIHEAIAGLSSSDITVFGFGNTAGDGLRVAEAIRTSEERIQIQS